MYLLNADGHVIRASDLFALDDQDAIEQARRRGALANVELWSGKRKVGLILCGVALLDLPQITKPQS
jgi:hypothetical protein